MLHPDDLTWKWSSDRIQIQIIDPEICENFQTDLKFLQKLFRLI